MNKKIKKKLSLQEAIQAGHYVYSLNTEKEASLRLAEHFACLELLDNIKIKHTLPCLTVLSDSRELFLWEWRAFVHAAIIHGLSKYAPAIVVVEYVRTVQNVLQTQYPVDYDELIKVFIDEPFSQYVQVVLEEKNQECPAIFFKRLFDIDIKNHIKMDTNEKYTTCLAGITSTMAMLFAASEDAFEKFDYALE